MGTLCKEKRCNVMDFAAKYGWSNADNETVALADIVAHNTEAGHATWYHGANHDAVIGMLRAARRDHIQLVEA